MHLVDLIAHEKDVDRLKDGLSLAQGGSDVVHQAVAAGVQACDVYVKVIL